MKTVDSRVKTAIRSNNVLYAVPKLTAEWNMNRYFSPKADNMPTEDSEGFDIEMFPIESIVMENRPTKGICKARINESATSSGYQTEDSRYYTGSVDDKYKYWTSPVQTNNSGVFPTHTDGSTKVRPYIVYNQSVSVNKIVVKVENYWASPGQFFIKTTTNANPTSISDWTTVATSPTVANDGTITLYWNGSSWSQTPPSSLIDPPLRSLRGVMIQVNTMTGGKTRSGTPTIYKRATSSFESGPYESITTNGSSSFFNLVEISALREVDLSDRLIEVNDDFDMSAVSELYPVGTITTNTGQITLSNIYTENGVQKTGYFSSENPNGKFYKILEKNVLFNLEYVYTINGAKYPVQQFKLYGEEWQGQVSDEVSIELKDFSKFFDEIYPRPALWSDLTVNEIIQRLLDSVGYVNWDISTAVDETDHIVPNFWVDGEMNVWEILDDLAKGTQTAIYFDGFGKLKVMTRSNAFDSAKSPVWTLRGTNSGTELADIAEISQMDELGANHLTVTYKTTEWSREIKGMPALDKVWEPDTDSVTLRASTLMKSIDNNSSVVQIPQEDAKVWPYSGMFEIQGEIFRYNGKRFCYHTYTENTSGGKVTYTNEQKHYVTVKSKDEQKSFTRKTPKEKRAKNHWTGGLALDQEKESRGVWNSEQRNHSVDINGWKVSRENVNGSNVSRNIDSAGMVHNKSDSSMRLKSKPKPGPKDITIATRGGQNTDGYKFFGTQIKLMKKSGYSSQQAGIVINCTDNFNGYYIELKASEHIQNKDRKSRGEIAMFNKTGSDYKQLGSKNFPIVEGLAYDVDVQFKDFGGSHRVIVWVNGRKALDETISSNKKSAGGQFATFVRGSSAADFQYFYAIRREVNDPDDDASFFNLKEGGYTGAFWDREWVWGWRTVNRRKKKKQAKEKEKWKIQFFDEFGPVVHEVREFDVKFDPAPVLHSRLYMTNEWSAICTEYNSTPFGAKFVLANAARENAVIHGEDSLSLGGGTSDSISQQLTVIGRVLVIQDAETVEETDEDSIKVRGKIEAEIESNWIQSKKMAKDITQWMRRHWSKGVDQLNVTSFGNPLIELGDVVSIDHPERFMSPSTHKYFVTGVKTTFDSGIATELKLRRVA